MVEWFFSSVSAVVQPETPTITYRQYQPQEHRSSYGSGPPARVLAPNASKATVGREANPYASRSRNTQPTPREMPDRTTSKNPYINGTTSWSYKEDGQLCVMCGTKGHIAPACDTAPLPAWLVLCVGLRLCGRLWQMLW